MSHQSHDPASDRDELVNLLRQWLFAYGILSPDAEPPGEMSFEALNDVSELTLRALAPVCPDAAALLAEIEADKPAA
jgi:hypothetical protein